MINAQWTRRHTREWTMYACATWQWCQRPRRSTWHLFVLKLQADLSEVGTRLLVTERAGKFVQRERAIYHRPQLRGVDCPYQIHLMTSAPNDQALQSLLARHQRCGGHRAGQTRQDTD